MGHWVIRVTELLWVIGYDGYRVVRVVELLWVITGDCESFMGY